MTKVSIIMPSLNVRKYIEDCIKSVITQSLKEIEVLCIDAGSTDGTLEILEKYAKEDHRIRILMANRRSYGYQVNLGIKEAKGKYIGIVETDDFIRNDMYEKLYNCAQSLKADIVKCSYVDYFDKDHEIQCYFADNLDRILPVDRVYSMKEYGIQLGYHCSVWAGLYLKSYLMDNNFYFVEADGAGYVDVGFRMFTSINTNRNAWLGEPLYYYRRSNASSSTNNYAILTMCRRWKEVHEKMKERQDEYNRFYGIYSALDEYMDTLIYIGKRILSNEELESLIDNYSYTPDFVIASSPILNHRIKKDILAFKHNPQKYYDNKTRLLKMNSLIYDVGNRLFPHGSSGRNQIKKVLFLRKRND